jgi:hypothetical protein
MAKSLTITWRDEAYGALSHKRAAFRVYGYGQTTIMREIRPLRPAYERAGFRFDNARAAWVADDVANARTLCEALAADGWTVEHAGRWPDGPPAA